MPRRKTTKFEVYFENQTSRYHVNRKKFEKLVKTVLKNLSFQEASVNFQFVTDQKMKGINKKVFRKNKTTDVISFPWVTFKKPTIQNGHLGDVVISLDRARIVCRQFETTFAEEFATYAIHGILHLVGYEDTTPSKKKKMFREQDRLLALLTSKKETLRGLIRFIKN